MKTLHLNLKTKWFDMILSGEKKEEYRIIKQYWIDRITNKNVQFTSGTHPYSFYKIFDTITFTNGYKKKARRFVIELKSIGMGTPQKIWCDPDDAKYQVFILKVGKILNTKNI